mgnify:CR=1 FL=1
MPQTTLTSTALTLTAYLARDGRLLDAARYVIGQYRWLTTGRIVALIGWQVYAGEVQHA